MLRSRLVAAVSRRSKGGACSSWIRSIAQESSASQGSGDTQGYAPMPTGRVADPAIHSSDPPEDKEPHEPNPLRTTHDEADPLAQPKSPLSPSLKIEHTEVGRSSTPNATQRRQLSKGPTEPPPEAIQDVSCAGLDGSPWPDDAEGQKAQKRDQEKDNKEYFKDHKASPLSELEYADSRKPITRATDSNSTSPDSTGVILFKEEQCDTAEESLLRAMEIWKWNKMRGDPDSPHGRVLRELRGEHW